MATPVSDHPTKESIQAAKLARDLERAQVTAATGVTLTEDGKMALTIATAIRLVTSRKGAPC